MSKYWSIILFVSSIALLVPGLTKPLMTIEATVDKKEMVELGASFLIQPEQQEGFMAELVGTLIEKMTIEGDVLVFKSTRSLLSTMTELVNSGHVLVGVMIGVFCLLIPLIKGGLVCVAMIVSVSTSARLLHLNSVLSKWSMSDVLVMAILVAFLAINANEYASNIVKMNATLHEGFYYFAAYCVLAIAAGQLMVKQLNQLKVE